MNRPRLQADPKALAVVVSVGLHVIAVGLACFLTFDREIEQPALTFTLDVLRDEPPELQVFRIAAAEPPSKSLSEPVANEISPIPPGSLSASDGLTASLAGIGSGAGIDGTSVDSNRSDRAENLLAYPITGVLDATKYYSNAPARLRSSVAGTNETRREAFSSLADEFLQIRPDHISAVIFVPIAGSPTERGTESGSESVQESVIEWARRVSSYESRDGIVHPSAQLIIIVSDSPVPMEKVRQVAGKWSRRVPMLVICVKPERTRIDELKSLAADSGGTNFGIK